MGDSMREKNLERKIFLRYTLFFVTIIILGIVAGNVLVYVNLRNRAVSNQEVLIDKNFRQLEREFELMNVITQQITFNKNIAAQFSKTRGWNGSGNYYDTNPGDGVALRSELYAILGMDITNTVINLYSESAFFSTSTTSVVWNAVRGAMGDGPICTLNQILEEKPTRAMTLCPVPVYWGDSARTQDIRYFSLSRRFYNNLTGKYIGVIQVLRPLDVLETLCRTTDNAMRILVFDSEGEIVVPESFNDAWRKSVKGLAAELGDGNSVRCHMPDGSYIASLRRNTELGYGMLILQSESVFDAGIVMGLLFSLAATALLIAAFLWFNRVASHSLTEPLNRITASLRAITWDNMEMSLPFKEENSDLQVLRQSCDAMLTRIRQSMNTVMESQLREQEAYYLALQSQISPHFLYNTLSSISALASENDVEKIPEICARMSHMLRYATNFSSRYGNLEQEIRYTENYLELMKVRYEDDFNYTIDLDERLAACPIPRLMLQAIVENCFKHAFPGVEAPWSINIYAYAQEDFWIVEVIDNGCGIDEKALEGILEKSLEVYQSTLDGMRDMTIGKLGLLNALVRLRLIYHNEIRFEARNMYRGTVIRFGGKR